MSKKHFKALAAAIAKISNDAERMSVAEIIGRVCAEENPRFRWADWNLACGIKSA